MFGYLVIADNLDKESQKRYRDCYCGLCHTLALNYGNTGRLTLSYDLTFVAMLLSAIYDEKETVISKHCPVHPLKKRTMVTSESYLHASKMNILLNYYKQLDDYHDDNNLKAKKMAGRLKESVDEIASQYSKLCGIIKDSLDEISKLEEANVLNPDLPANLFGQLMAEIFIVKEDENSENLRKFGYHLGRFIYLMDAVMDLKDDLKKEAYNPLMMMDSNNFEDMLMMVMEDCCQYYEKLNLHKDKEILDNVVYSGVWSAYFMKKHKKEGGK